jgi:Fe-S cluster biogenesis protein NfuA
VKFDSVTDVQSRTSPDPDATGPIDALGASPLATTLSDEDPREDEAVMKLCRDVLSPLVAADGGVMYIVRADAEEVHLHLTGTCAGCPGAALTRDGIIAPAVRTVAPKARVVVTTGPRVPEGAKKIS